MVSYAPIAPKVSVSPNHFEPTPSLIVYVPLPGTMSEISSDPPIKYSIVTNGFLFHLAASAITIPVDFIFGFDFMLYRDLGGVPFFEGVASSFTEKGLAFLNPVLMLALYFAMFSAFWLIYAGLKNRKKKVGEEAPTSL